MVCGVQVAVDGFFRRENEVKSESVKARGRRKSISVDVEIFGWRQAILCRALWATSFEIRFSTCSCLKIRFSQAHLIQAQWEFPMRSQRELKSYEIFFATRERNFKILKFIQKNVNEEFSFMSSKILSENEKKLISKKGKWERIPCDSKTYKITWKKRETWKFSVSFGGCRLRGNLIFFPSNPPSNQ